MRCGERYNFDGAEALEWLGVGKGKERVKKVKVEKVEKVKVEKVKVEKVEKVKWPFSKENVKKEGCEGIKYEQCLFTQCDGKKVNEKYCGKCLEECGKNASGMPDGGTVEERLKCGLMEYRDTKGRKPINYVKYLIKTKKDVEEVKKMSKEMNVFVDEIHWTEEEVKKGRKKTVKKEEEQGKEKKRGRPKKIEEVKKEEVKDLFAELVKESLKEKCVEKVEEKVEEKAEEKVVEKKEEKVVEKKKGKKAVEKKVKKEVEKKSKKVEKKVEKEEVKKIEEVKEEKKEEVKKVTVKRVNVDGVEYLWSQDTNVIYDMKTKEEVGIYDAVTKTIKELPEDGEIEEEEYESEEE